MLQSISWSQYFLVISISTALYYLFIWLVFFKGRFAFYKYAPSFLSAPSQGEDAPDEVMVTVQFVVDELRPLFAGRRNRSELLLSLRQQLVKYRDYEPASFREIINEFISQESERQCSIRLSEEDLRAVWL